MSLLDKIFGTYSDKELKRIKPIADKVMGLESKYQAMSNAELQAMTPALKERLAKGETLDDILPDAYAVCREASWRVLGMKHFPVQIIGGIVLHRRNIAEMRTGEGKTLVATLPVYLNALTGEGVHVVTVNGYLARRDSEWMGKLYRFLGLSVGLVIAGIDPDQRRAAYACDITYGTNNEFGFDYLRDNMVTYKNQMVQRGHAFAVVDEVDSILIDEARTPLIISGAGDKSSQLYTQADAFVRRLRSITQIELEAKEAEVVEAAKKDKEVMARLESIGYPLYERPDRISNDMRLQAIGQEFDYVVDEKQKIATLTMYGIKKAEAAFHVENIADNANMELFHHINQAVKAHGVMKRDVNYVVKDGEVIIVDEFTGRLMIGRRYNEGLHQAIEAKEGVKIADENRTVATITFQNYFRMYKKLAGMTGTALTEAEEFREIYGLEVVTVPTNKPIQRKDLPDSIYKTEAAKFNAVIEQVVECHQKGQPVLVGTVSIEKSEHLSALLKRRGIKHEVLNAKYHEKEAAIVAQAGKFGAVTIATNMAGRGTDITLGGNAEYMAKAAMAKEEFPEELIAEADGHGDTDDEAILAARARYEELYKSFKPGVEAEAEKVRAAGGLFIVGTERHESRRIDNQLRGRAGRQGDPGCSRFFLSMEDDLMRLFGGERMQSMMSSLGVEDDMPIDSKIVSNALESAQKKLEARNFQTRKSVLSFDDVMNTQRQTIYAQRQEILEGKDLSQSLRSMLEETVRANVAHYTVGETPEDWNLAGLRQHYLGWLTLPTDFQYTTEQLNDLEATEISEMLITRGNRILEAKEKRYTAPVMREFERICLLQNIDRNWMDHIDDMDQLRKGIYLRSYGQKDPVVEYRLEGFEMFDAMVDRIREGTVRLLLTAELRTRREEVLKPTATSGGGDDTAANQPVKAGQKIGRNDPCPCGSGLKWKKCTCAKYHPELSKNG
ncbi:MAG TPA: preprotein translocase subunit SecA [Candidatus Anaerofilum excrementigallinarum]|nr:preprotein translocase subunit SecA [Candidatus Anaerofilum excrementigallinarum]